MTPRASGSNPESRWQADDRSEAAKNESPKKKISHDTFWRADGAARE